jgi:hypothetical protein
MPAGRPRKDGTGNKPCPHGNAYRDTHGTCVRCRRDKRREKYRQSGEPAKQRARAKQRGELAKQRETYRRSVHDPIVYFIRAGDYVKIGRTHSIKTRLKELRTGCPLELQVLKTCRGGVSLEKELHDTLSAHHHRGEWFRLEGDLATFLGYKRETPT